MRLLKLSLNRIAVSRTGIGTVSVGVFLLLFLGCGQPPDLHDAETLSRILADALDMDVLQVRGDEGIRYAPNQSEPYSGWVKRMHKVGSLETPSPQVQFLLRLDAGLVASAFTWHKNGQMQGEAHYEDGELAGRSVRWYENGQMKSEEHYEAGKRAGRWVWWHKNGQMQREAHYEDGELAGRSVRWYENGQMKSEEHYEAGKRSGRWVAWHENGQMESEEHYEAGKRTGRWVAWHENGQMQREERYEAGERRGLRTVWDSDGGKEIEFDYDTNSFTVGVDSVAQLPLTINGSLTRRGEGSTHTVVFETGPGCTRAEVSGRRGNFSATLTNLWTGGFVGASDKFIMAKLSSSNTITDAIRDHYRMHLKNSFGYPRVAYLLEVTAVECDD